MRPLHGITLALLALFAAAYGYSEQQREHYQQTLQPHIEPILAEISDWRAESLSRRLSPEARAATSEAQLSQLLNQYRPLGRLQTIEQLEFSRLSSLMSLIGPTRISYQGVVNYQAGAADITLTVLERDGKFSIYNLNLSPRQQNE